MALFNGYVGRDITRDEAADDDIDTRDVIIGEGIAQTNAGFYRSPRHSCN